MKHSETIFCYSWWKLKTNKVSFALFSISFFRNIYAFRLNTPYNQHTQTIYNYLMICLYWTLREKPYGYIKKIACIVKSIKFSLPPHPKNYQQYVITLLVFPFNTSKCILTVMIYFINYVYIFYILQFSQYMTNGT